MSKHFNRNVAAYRSAISNNDSTTIDNTFLGAVDAVELDQNNVPIHARFSAAAQSVTVALVATWKDPSDGTESLVGVSDPITLTAGTLQDGAASYLSPLYVADALGARFVRLLVIAKPGSGTCDLYLGNY